MIAIISDIHGNYPALRAVLAAIDAMDVESIISLGDVAGYYSMII
jgi:predicted phosphodiesterase